MTLTPLTAVMLAPASRSHPSSADPTETPAHKKLRKAAQEFEGMLISQLWGECKLSFSALTGDGAMAGSDTLNSLTIQSLSTGLASRGGLGIAQMLVRQLAPNLERHDAQPRTRQTKG